jgi:hypothetical protein
MICVLAHVTPHEFPIGMALFLGGLGVGVGLGIYLKYFRTG